MGSRQLIGFSQLIPKFAPTTCMKRIIVFLVIIICALPFSQNGYTQAWRYYRHEVRLGFGASNFLGELGGANNIGTNRMKDLEFAMTRPAVDVMYAYKINPSFKARTHLLYGRLNGDDALTEERFRNNRNLSFRSPVVELAFMVEYYPLTEKLGHLYALRGVKAKKKLKYLAPYITTGIAGFWFNPRAKYPVDGKYYSLHKLGTEGQGLPGGAPSYKRVSLCIPSGIGVNYMMNKYLSIGFEIGGRLTFTDYIDDVSTVYYNNAAIQSARGDVAAYFADPSKQDAHLIADAGGNPTRPGLQRGDKSDNDSYMFAIFRVNYRFLKGRFVLPKF